MVVQPRPHVFRCFRQHDHAIASGELAKAWRWAHDHEHSGLPSAEPSGPPSAATQLAVTTHDIGWVAADVTPVFDPERLRPFDFTTLPLAERLTIYRRGIDEMERLDPYAGLLGSIHFSGFIHPGVSAEFATFEQNRRNRIGETLDFDAHRVGRDYNLLKALDLASLIICLSQPGSTPDERPPWLGDTLHVNGVAHTLTWEDATTLICTPSPFDAPVQLHIPYRDIPRDACTSAQGLAEAWDNATPEVLAVTVR